MDLKEIRIVLERFYEGATTSSQEEQLKDFFMSKDVPEDLIADKKNISGNVTNGN